MCNILAHLKDSVEANRLRRKREEEAEVGDLNLKQMLRTWVGSSRRESLRAELKVVTFTLLLVTSILNDIETSMVVLLFCNFHM